MRAATAATLLLAACHNAAACDLGTLSQQTATIEATCCAGQEHKCTTKGLPKSCSKACAPAFNAFWEDCGAYLKYLPTFSSAFTDFSQKCQHEAPSKPPPTDDCSPGKLLTIMFFSCSDVNNNDANEFCGTKCNKEVEDFVARCKSKEEGESAESIKQASKWLSNCVKEGPSKMCHDEECGGEHETQCNTADSESACKSITESKTNPVECSWKVCANTGDHHSPPPAPKIIPGCMDHKALNYDPAATVQADGACVYGHVKPPTGGVCDKRRPYGCHTEATCKQNGFQWLSCLFMQMNMGDLKACQHTNGECVRPCTASSYGNCHTQADCTAASTPQRPLQWYQPPKPYTPPGKKPRTVQPRCERACSKTSSYYCHDQHSCESVGHQWKPPSRPVGGGQFMDSGRCTNKCSKAHYSYCYSEAACKGVGMQWTMQQCCGTSCPPQGLGRCQRPCSAHSPYSCRTQLACESIGRQWVPRTRPASSTCKGPAGGSCSLPCTEKSYYNCKVPNECQAIGMEWHPATKTTSPGFNGRPPHTYTRSARCAYPCSIMRSNECDTKKECDGIGFMWIDVDGDGPIQGHCEKPCSATNYGGCKDQGSCEGAGNQWIIEDVFHGRPNCPDCGGGIIIDPGFGGGGGGGPVLPPGSHATKVGRCIEACSPAHLYNCKSPIACGTALGIWHAFPARNGKPSTGGNCETGCTSRTSYQCHDKPSCQRIGGIWQARVSHYHPHNRPPPPPSYFCNVTTASCDISTIMGQCAASTSNGLESYQLCDAACGRFITRNFDKCSAAPPAGMTKSQFKEMFGPITQMCKTVTSDPTMRRCASESDEAVMTMQRVCCTDDKNCAANGGIPTKCTGDCADAFLPYFETCGGLMLTQKNDPTSLSKFYQVCTSSHASVFDKHDPKLCHANSGNSPWTAIEYRANCEVWVKYVDAHTNKESAAFVRLVSVGTPPIAIQQILNTAKTVCKKNHMVQSVATEMSGLMALEDIVEKGKMMIEVFDNTKGNTMVQVTNNGKNRDKVRKQWKKSYNPNTFNPDHCPSTYGR